MWKKLSNFCTFDGALVEVTFFLYKVGESMMDTSIRPYILDTTCFGMFPDNLTLCEELYKYRKTETLVQQRAARNLIYYKLLVNIPAIFLGLFFGAWSDRAGRKVPMVLPSLGSVLAVLLYMVSLINSTSALSFILAGALVQGLFGKSAVVTMAVNSYVADTSERDDRTRKLGKLQAMNFFGLFFGSLASGSLTEFYGLETILCIIVFMHGTTILIVLMCVPESPTADKQHLHECVENEKSAFSFSDCLGPLKPSNLKESICILVKNRTANTRCVIIVLVLVSVMNQTCKSGEMDVGVLFVKHSPLNWPQSWYGYMLALDYAIMGLSLFFALPLLSNLALLSDVSIIMIAVCFRIIRLFWVAFATQTWMVYVSVLVGTLGALTVSASRSLLSKTVNEDELGKMFAILASGETVSKLLGTVIFTNIYAATASFFPGFAYIIEGFVYIVLFFSMIWFKDEVKLCEAYKLLDAVKSNGEDDDMDYNENNEDNFPPPENCFPFKKTVRFQKDYSDVFLDD